MAKFKQFPPEVSELDAGLRSLTFRENFTSFVVDNLSIPAGAEVQVQNQLAPRVPRYWLLLDTTREGGSGSPRVVRGAAAWNANLVTLRNVGDAATVVSVVFLLE